MSPGQKPGLFAAQNNKTLIDNLFPWWYSYHIGSKQIRKAKAMFTATITKIQYTNQGVYVPVADVVRMQFGASVGLAVMDAEIVEHRMVVKTYRARTLKAMSAQMEAERADYCADEFTRIDVEMGKEK